MMVSERVACLSPGRGPHGKPDTSCAQDRRCSPAGLRHRLRAARSLGIAVRGRCARNHHLHYHLYGDGLTCADYYDGFALADHYVDSLAQPLHPFAERQDAQLRRSAPRTRSAHAWRRVPLRVSDPEGRRLLRWVARCPASPGNLSARFGLRAPLVSTPPIRASPKRRLVS